MQCKVAYFVHISALEHVQTTSDHNVPVDTFITWVEYWEREGGRVGGRVGERERERERERGGGERRR